jgi:tripartite-type tricarboxylate transporter receptor subunit TctC
MASISETISMKMIQALCLCTALFASTASSAQTESTAYPTRPIKLVVAWSPGGATDILARMVAVELSKQLGQSLVIENRPGANGTIGQTQVATSAPDGYTLILATNSTYAIADHLYKALPYKQERDFEPISLLASSPLIMTVRPTLNVNSVKELIEMARKEPGKLNIASGGNGSTSHLAAELFMALTGTSMTHVPYKGGAPATTAVVAGEVDIAFLDLGVAMPFISSGGVKAIGVTGTSRSSLLPDVPAISEAGIPQFEATTNFALFAPAATPKPIIDRLHGAVRGALAEADLRDKLRRQGVELIGSTADELRSGSLAESTKWGKIISDRRISFD